MVAFNKAWSILKAETLVCKGEFVGEKGKVKWCKYVCVCFYIYTYMYVYIILHVYTHVCVYMHIYI